MKSLVTCEAPSKLICTYTFLFLSFLTFSSFNSLPLVSNVTSKLHSLKVSIKSHIFGCNKASPPESTTDVILYFKNSDTVLLNSSIENSIALFSPLEL